MTPNLSGHTWKQTVDPESRGGQVLGIGLGIVTVLVLSGLVAPTDEKRKEMARWPWWLVPLVALFIIGAAVADGFDGGEKLLNWIERSRDARRFP